MTTIDAAIIKALVEHIGMDPDSIPSGGGSTSGGTTVVNGSLVKRGGTITVDSSNKLLLTPEDITIGDILRIAFDGGYQTYMLCKMDPTTGNHIFISVDGEPMKLVFVNSGGKLMTEDPLNSKGHYSENTASNTNVGIFRYSDSLLAGFFYMILTFIDGRYDA